MSNPESHQDQLQTIDPAALAQVSGGATSTSTSTSSDQILTALTEILHSIHSLANQQTNGGFNQQEMLLLMRVMQQRNQQPIVQPIVRYC